MQNLYLSVKAQGWELDYKKFRIYLKDKYQVSKAYAFLGYISKNEKFYKTLRDNGYKIIFKPTIKRRKQPIKGNCDTEFVLHTILQINNFNKAIIISGDGDFYCLIRHLKQKNKLLKIGIPNQARFSYLLKRFKTDLLFISQLEEKLKKEAYSPGQAPQAASRRIESG